MKHYSNPKNLWKTLHQIHTTENRTAHVLKNQNVQLNQVTIRYTETLNTQEVSYQIKVEQPYVMIHYVFNGNLWLIDKNKRQVELKSHHQYLHFVPAGNDYTVTYPKQVHTCWMTIMIDLEFMTDLLSRTACKEHWLGEYIKKQEVFFDRQGMPSHPDVTQSALALMNPLVNEQQQTHALFMTSKVMELLSYSLSHNYIASSQKMQFKGFSQHDVSRFHELKAYLNNKFTEEHSIAGLAKHFGLNECKLKKGFKELFGHTIFGYITDLKMQKAQQMLQNGYPVSEVSDVLGYGYPQHFSKAFKNKFGVSPSQYGQSMLGLAG